jgi:hypothetical protein
MRKLSWKQTMFLGASLGALATLFHKETRQGAGVWGRNILTEMREYRRHPSKAVHDLRMAVQKVDRFADTFVHELESAESMFEKEHTNTLTH